MHCKSILVYPGKKILPIILPKCVLSMRWGLYSSGAYIKIKLFQVGLIFVVGLIITRAYIPAGTVCIMYMDYYFDSKSRNLGNFEYIWQRLAKIMRQRGLFGILKATVHLTKIRIFCGKSPPFYFSFQAHL